ncbi:MAG: 4Fe-4S dicluster domain-containing protein [Nitrospirota bacterium]|nr:4Fe-4S dicluster domain-containing protein [Nitrospirota bacterium]
MFDGRDELDIIQEDIKRALGKPDTKWAMLIDLRRCTACKACTAGCVAEQKSPPGVMYRPVYEEESGTFPNVKRRFTPRPCLQCDEPPCVEACPNKGENKATWKAKNGIVMINYNQCIGCGRCVIACPYKARTLDAGYFHTEGTPAIQEYETAPTWEYSRKWPREKNHIPINNARKCHFCYHRLKNGMVPMCVSTCICRANYFGDPEDKDSLIHKVLRANKIMILTEVKSPGETKLKNEQLKGKTPGFIASAVGYPGSLPVFSDKAKSKPRVFYILPEGGARK